MPFDHVFNRMIREEELKAILPLLNGYKRVLEIGAGSGYQARKLQELGFEVSALEIDENTLYSEKRYFEVKFYDGINIPFPDKSFDVVFSSSVLEHVGELENLLSEIRRVLDDDGICIHVMPCSAWRFFTLLTFYPARIVDAICLIRDLFLCKRKDRANNSSREGEQRPRKGYMQRLCSAFFPTRHGERGNVITEHYYFSVRWWSDFFRDNGWVVEEVFPAGVFYSGSNLLGRMLPLAMRKIIARFLASACNVFVVKKDNRSNH